jgi:hypothetical protein
MTAIPAGGEAKPSEVEELKPTKVDLPADAPTPAQPIRKRRDDDHRPRDYRVPPGPFRPRKDIGDAATVEESKNDANPKKQ